jgi:hypothetical protein
MEPMATANRRRCVPLFFLVLLFIIQLIIFGPHVGRGFVTDDFNWLENVVRSGKVEYLRPFTATTGFFRPLVGLSFGIQYQLHGMNPKAYGLFNLFVHLLNIILVYLLLSEWDKSKFLALSAAALFALNAKAADMAVGWISGRTTLMFSFFMLLTLYLFLKDRYNPLSHYRPFRFICISTSYMAALLAKETAAAAPIFVFFFTLLNSHRTADGPLQLPGVKESFKKGAKAVIPFILPLVIYFLLRFNSDAFTPLNAPAYYRYSFDPLVILKNISEYIIRAGMLDIYIMIVFIIIGSIFGLKKKSPGKRFNSNDKGTFPAWGLWWFFCFLLPALPLSIRSDLYAYFPQIGLHVVFLYLITRLFHNYKDKINIKNKKKKKIMHGYALGISIGVLLAAWMGYLWIKAESYGKKASSSTVFADQMVKAASQIAPGSRILIIDTQVGDAYSPSQTVAYGFNPMLNLYYPHKHFSGTIIPFDKIPEIKGKEKKSPGVLYFIWNNNQLIRAPFL